MKRELLDTPKAKHKLEQKDTNARWTKKNNEPPTVTRIMQR